MPLIAPVISGLQGPEVVAEDLEHPEDGALPGDVPPHVAVAAPDQVQGAHLKNLQAQYAVRKNAVRQGEKGDAFHGRKVGLLACGLAQYQPARPFTRR